MVQGFWRKLNGNERLVTYGAIAVIVASLLGGAWLSLVGGLAVLVIYWLMHSADQNVRWPLPHQTIVLAIAAVLAIAGLLGTLSVFGFIGPGFGLAYGLGFGLLGPLYVLYMTAAVGGLIGALVMMLGAWREYQTTTPSGS